MKSSFLFSYLTCLFIVDLKTFLISVMKSHINFVIITDIWEEISLFSCNQKIIIIFVI